jgi:hypothetical protein
MESISMKQISLAVTSLFVSSVAQAGHMDGLAFQTVPVMNEISLFALAISAGLAGAWGIRRMRNKD